MSSWPSPRPSIQCLLTGCRPAHVARFIIALIIREPINRIQQRRPTTNIGDKSFERFIPAVAHLNAARAIPFVCARIFIVAACFYTLPNPVFSRPASAPRLAVRQQSSHQSLSRNAATRSRVACIQMVERNNAHLSAIALAPEKSVLECLEGGRFFDDQQAPKAPPNNGSHGSLLSSQLPTPLTAVTSVPSKDSIVASIKRAHADHGAIIPVISLRGWTNRCLEFLA